MVEGLSGASPSGAPGGSERQHSGLLRPEMLFASVWLIPVLLGAVFGTVAWLISGWPWWPLIGAAALWSAAFLIPRYWPGLRAERWSLRTELLLMFAPGRGVARMRTEEEQRFRRAAFPLYGLPSSSPGEHYLAASGTIGSWRRAKDVRWFSLGHGEPRLHPGGSWLIVETALSRTAPADTVRQRRLADRLWNLEQWATVLQGGPSPSRLPTAQRPEPRWSATRIAIDDELVAFEYLVDGERWAAWAAHRGLVVSLLASQIPLESVTLSTVADLQPYIDGSRRHNAAGVCAVPPGQNTPTPREDPNTE